MLTTYDPRFAHFFGISRFAPPGDDDDDDDDDKSGKGGKGGKGGGGGGGGDPDALKAIEADRDKWKRLSRGHEDKSKDLQKELDALKAKSDDDTTGVQKLTERVEAAERELAESKLDALRMKIAARKGLTEAQAKRLVGKTEEELEEDADDLLETFKPSADDGDGDRGRARGRENRDDRRDDNGSRRPRENLRPGAKPDAKVEETDPIKLAEAVPRL